MARIHDRRRAASAGAGAARHRQATAGVLKKPSYKVVLEEVSEQRKLKTFLSFNAEAPPGFTFIPAGDPQLTNRCKQLARDDGSTVYIVTMSDPNHPELSHEVHRVGYHFSSRVVEKACTSLGVTLTESGRVLQSSFATLTEDIPTRHGKKPKTKGKGKARASPPKFDLSQSQATIDTQAREAIKDLFPKIPESDLHETVARSFQKGRELVGTSSDLSLARRAHLAVLAHIRHTHTNYDNLLKLVPYSEARKRVEGPTLDILISWRDDVDDDTNVMRDVLREVIIISDNEDEESNLTKVKAMPRDNRELREKSIEIISASSNVHTQRVDLAMEPSELEDERRIQYIPRASISGSGHPHDHFREERKVAERHRRWEAAVSRQRKGSPSSGLHPRAAQFVSEPSYHPAAQNDSKHPSRLSENTILGPLHRVHAHPRINQNDDSQSRPLYQDVKYLPQRTTNLINNDISDFAVPVRQIRYSSEQHPTTTATNPEHQGRNYQPLEYASDHRYVPSEGGSHYLLQASLEKSAERKRFVEIQQPREIIQIRYNTTDPPISVDNERRQQRRHESERILPSVEGDEYDVTATNHIVREGPLHLNQPPPQLSSQDHQRYVLESGNNNVSNLKRTFDEQEVYVIEQRQRPPPFEGQRRLLYPSVDSLSSRETLRHQIAEQNIEKAPVVVQYDSRVVPPPPRARAKVPNPELQAIQVPQSRTDRREQLIDSGREPERVYREIRRASDTQPVRQTVVVREPHRTLGGSPIQPNSFRDIGAVEPTTSRIVRMDNARGITYIPPTEGPHRSPQMYDQHGRLVNDNFASSHETAMYASSRR